MENHFHDFQEQGIREHKRIVGEKMQKNLPYIFISFGIAIIVCLLSFLDVYDNFEHTLLDMRFKSRGLIRRRRFRG